MLLPFLKQRLTLIDKLRELLRRIHRDVFLGFAKFAGHFVREIILELVSFTLELGRLLLQQLLESLLGLLQLLVHLIQNFLVSSWGS